MVPNIVQGTVEEIKKGECSAEDLVCKLTAKDGLFEYLYWRKVKTPPIIKAVSPNQIFPCRYHGNSYLFVFDPFINIFQ